MKLAGLAVLGAVGLGAVVAQSKLELIPLTPDIKADHFFGVIAPPGEQFYRWGTVTQIDSYADSKDAVSLYVKTNRMRGGAPAFGLVAEVQDTTGDGAIWGAEVDVIVTGTNKNPNTIRTGMGVVYGKHHLSKDPGVIDVGYWLLPWQFNGKDAKVKYGFRAEVGCEIACVSIPPGSWMTFDGPGNVGMRFDEQTGYLHFGVRGKTPALSVQMETGAMLVGGRPASR